MSTIIPIASGDLISNSRTDINTNFSNLNTDKIETSVIDTDSALSANSDSLIPSQKAVKAYVDSANLSANAAKTIIPFPNFPLGQVANGNLTSVLNIVTATTAFVGQIVIPFSIVANKISFHCLAASVAGTFKIALFSEDGQTQIFSVTTASITTSGIKTTTLSAVSIPAGVYYIVTVPVSTVNLDCLGFYTSEKMSTLNSGVSSEPILEGTLAVTAGTMPSTITPTAISTADNRVIVWRLDN